VPERPAALQEVVLLANPVAGRRQAVARAQALAARLRAGGAPCEVVATASGAGARARAGAAARAGALVVAAGGDGHVAAVATGVVEHDGALAVLPAGRGNDFAAALGVPADDAALARALLAGAERRVDLLDAGDRLVLGSVATGVDAVADATVDALRRARLPAQAAYRVAALAALASFAPAPYAVTVDGGPSFEVLAWTVVVANAATYGAGLRIAPGALVDDGALDVVVLGATARRRFPRLLADVGAGTHGARADVTVLRGTRATVAAGRPLAARADGEPLAPLPLEVALRPAALRVRGV